LLNFSYVVFSQKKDDNMKKATSFMNEGNYREAANIFDEILIEEPQNSVALYNAALCELYNGRADLSIIHLKRFLRNNKQDSDVSNLLGLTFERLRNLDSAIINYSYAINLEKNYYEAYLNRGRCYILQKKISEAKADFNYAKKNKTINPNLYLESGKLNYELKFYDSAITDFRKITKYKNDDVYYLTMFANSFYQKSNFDSAIKYYTQILEIEPENISVLNNRSVCYGELEIREKQEADVAKIEEIRKKAEFDPNELEYRTLVPIDSAFSIDIPTQWRIFARRDTTVSEVIFFDPEFQNSEENGMYRYAFGGTLIYYPQYFPKDSNLMKSLQTRDSKVIEYQTNRKEMRNKITNGFMEKMRKTYNPNDDNARELLKTKFFDITTDEEYSGTEYFIMTTTGKLICLYLWLPEEFSFKYESIMDRIQSTLQLTVEQ
jgi:tetratricopeptide (TPR) repeat protein